MYHKFEPSSSPLHSPYQPPYQPELKGEDMGGDDFTFKDKSPQQLVQRVQQRMQQGKKLTPQEMQWAFSHGGFDFHQRAGAHQQRIRTQVAKNNAEAGANSVDASALHGITTQGFQENKNNAEKKRKTPPNPLASEPSLTASLNPQVNQEYDISQSASKTYGGGGEEDRKSLNSAFIIYETNLTEDILTGIFGPFYAKVLAGNKKYVKSTSKASFEIPFNKSTNKKFAKDHKYGVFKGDLKTYADNNLSKVTISAFRDKTNIHVVDPENPALNLEVKGNLEFMSLSQKGQKTEFSVAKAEGKIAYTINRANLLSKQGMPGFIQVIKEKNPQLYEALERGEILLDFVFTVSIELDVKGVWEIIEDLDNKKLKEKQKTGHENERDKHKKKEKEAKDSKDSKRKERNKLDDDTRKKEKQLKKLEKNPTDANLEERTRLNTEIDEQKIKSDELKKDIDKLKDEVEDARKAASEESKSAKKLKKEINKISNRVKNKKIPSLRDKLRENLTKENVERITQKVIDKSGQLVEKLSKKVLGKAATQLLKKAVMTAAKLVLRLIPVVGFLIMLWDIVSTLWDIGKAIWDWFTDDDKKEGGGGSDEDGDEGNEQVSGEAADGNLEGEGDGTGTGSGEGTGSGSGEKVGAEGTVSNGQNTTSTGTTGTEKSDTQKQPTVEAQQGGGTTLEKVEKEEESLENIRISQSDEVVNGTPAVGFESLQYFAPTKYANESTIYEVQLRGLFHSKPFFTKEDMVFISGKNENGQVGYIARNTFSFNIDSKVYYIEKGKFVKTIIFH
jgi:hypothetical protein